MKRFIFCILVLCLSSQAKAEELTWGSNTTYAPMPVLFIHGINSNCKAWEKTIPQLEKYFGYRLVKFKNTDPDKMWISPYDKDRTKGVSYFYDEENGYESPAVLYLEAFDYGGEDKSKSFKSISSYQPEIKRLIEGGIDPIDNKWKPGILESYYGNNWKNNPNAKIMIIGYSQGGLVARFYIQQEGKVPKRQSNWLISMLN